ncbi:VWA domain-containing protein [Cytobacillus sp. Hz8]|uniref:VWA domain-containing protein n=1 Tax=Cytobacillus sp. Hz8 TaxID=3347168 RepID=UPI0035DAB63A
MKRRLQFFSNLTIILFLLLSTLYRPVIVNAAEQPSVDFSVTPSSSQYTLTPDGTAEGSLNINVTPKGSASNINRGPMDVVFVHDTSGSMDYILDGVKKSVSAKKALLDAVSYFNQNKQTGDNYYFVPFSDDVRKSGDVKVVEGLDNIANTAKSLDRSGINTGGTNYTQTLEYAKSLLLKSNNKNKYIVFLTDGEPTVLNYQGWKYILYTNGTALYQGFTSSRNYTKTKNLIQSVALQTSDELDKNNITMYSIGFADPQDIDFQLLQNMSAKTGGYAVQANTSNLTKLFQEISKKIDSYAIRGEVTVDLSKFSGKVNVKEGANAVVDSNSVAHIPFQFNFPVGMQPDPSNLQVTLPLVFTDAGTYTFDAIKLQYDGLTTPKIHAPFTITINKDMTSQPAATFSVKPSADEFIKPPDENAKGNIDVTITPKGMAPKDNRLPIDVVFVHDTSGSMAETLNGARKDTTAKNALISSVNYFLQQQTIQNPKLDDTFYFVPFDDDISKKSYFNSYQVEPTSGLSNIKNMANNLDYNYSVLFLPIYSTSSGGTNYTAALNEAMTKFNSVRKSNKYIIFLTDGEPTVLKKNNDYMLYSDGKSGKYNGIEFYNNTTKYNETKAIINAEAKNSATVLGRNNISMYSIGFANEGDVDFQLLQDMSGKTGGYALQGSSSNLTNIFNDISKKVNSSTIAGNVIIDLKKFNGDVIVDPASNIQANSDQMVQIPFKITFPVGEKPSPNVIQQSLPLQFKKAGSYEFKDNVKMTYTDIDGNEQTIINPPFTAVVRDEAAPQFLNEVNIKGNQYFSPDSLVKLGTTDSERNEFTVEYKLIPDTVFTDITKGKINGLKITQPLPKGISLANANQIALFKNNNQPLTGASVQLINNGTAAEISLGSNEITYESGKFSLDNFIVQLKLKADWALPLTALPQANLNFYDSRFKDQEQTLNIDDQLISMTVRIAGMNEQYIGNYNGTIGKVRLFDGELVAETQLTNESGSIEKPVKGMELINDNKAIQVTYNDNSKAILHLKTDFNIRNLTFNQDLKSGDTTKGRVAFKITDLVPGNDVKYEYMLKSGEKETQWTAFDPSATIEIPKEMEGRIEILVRTIGGFSLNSDAISKTITIIREKIVVQPDPIELNVGDSVEVNLRVNPDDTMDRQFDVTVADQTVAKYENGKITGLKEGETQLIVRTTDIDGDWIEKRVTIKINAVLIESIRVTPNPLNLKKFVDFSDFTIDIEPENATNKNLRWTSLNQSIIEILENGKVRGLSTGTAEVEIAAEDGGNARTAIQINVGSPLTGIEASPAEINVKKGAVFDGNDNIQIHPSDATNIKDGPNFQLLNVEESYILGVEADGKNMKAKRLGSATVRITLQDENGNIYSTLLKVNVVESNSNDNGGDDKY